MKIAPGAFLFVALSSMTVAQSFEPVQSTVLGAAGQQNVVLPTTGGATLWRNIVAGMSIDQLHALYPEHAGVKYGSDRLFLSDIAIVDKCEADVEVMHKSGFVDEIMMKGKGSLAGRCSEKVITALSSKYGEPLDTEHSHGSIFAREGKIFIWNKNGVTLHLKRYTNGPLGGGGLFARSWELRYTSIGATTDL